MKILLGILFIVLTVVVFYLSKKIYRFFPSPFTLPMFLATIFLVVFLLAADISYDTYMIGGKWVDLFLGPVVVSLALPLYRQLPLIKKYATAIFSGILAGAIVGVGTGILFAKLLHFDRVIVQTVASKSVTTPVSLSITNMVEGNLPLAAVFVTIAGISGAMFGPWILKICKIEHPVAKGLAIGTASHAIGTSKALELGELEGAVSALSMTLSAIIVSLLIPVFLYVL